MSFIAGTDWLLDQIRVFAAALVGGALLGCCWQLYSVLYRPRSRRRRDWLLPDLVFSLAVAVLLAAYWFAFTDGGLRPQDFLWLACGLGLFRLLPALRLPRLSRRPRQHRSSRMSGGRSAQTGHPQGSAKKAKRGRKKPRPDPALRAVARWSARVQDKADMVGRRLRERLPGRKKRGENDDAGSGGGQAK